MINPTMRIVIGICVWSLLLVCFGTHQAAGQATRRVPADFPTIQEAINVAVDGDTVLVAAGDYQERIRFLGKAIHVLSEDGPASTTIDGNISTAVGSTVLFVDDEGPDSILEGFTITGGTGTQLKSGDTIGGGVLVFLGGNPTIRGNIITQNSSMGRFGGGIATLEASITVEDNTITGNFGGGLFLSEGADAPTTVRRNIIDSNTDGEGLQIQAAVTAIVEDNQVFNNEQDGIQVSLCDLAIVKNNIVMMNGTGGATAADNGIRMQNIQLAEVCSNTVINNPSDGITVRNSEVVTITDNVSQDNGGDGMFIWIIDVSADVARNITSGNAENGNQMRNVLSLICRNELAVDNGESGLFLRDCNADVNGVTAFRNGEYGLTSASNDTIQISNSIIWGNGDGSGSQFDEFLVAADIRIDFCNVQNAFVGLPSSAVGNTGVGNIDADPMFVDPNGPDGDPDTFADNDYRLQAGSPCVDAGDSTLWMCSDIDLNGNPRTIDGSLVGPEAADIGALEFNNVYLTVIGEPAADGTVMVEVTGTAGMNIDILVGTAMADNCSDYGPLYLDEITATTFGPQAGPAVVQIQLPIGVAEHVIQAIAVTATNSGIGNTSNPVTLAFEVEAFALGDVNRDGVIDLLDVQPFVDLLLNGGFQFEADLNGDGTVDLLDVAPFVALLLG